jgi:hypothetical protein
MTTIDPEEQELADDLKIGGARELFIQRLFFKLLCGGISYKVKGI